MRDALRRASTVTPHWGSYGQDRHNSITAMTTAASPRTGTNQCVARFRRRLTSPSSHTLRPHMTIPAPTSKPKHATHPDTPQFATPPVPDAAAMMRHALGFVLSPKAFKMYAATVLELPTDEWLTADAMGAAAGLSGHQARPLVAELVNAGLLRRQKVIVYPGGVPSARNRYAVTSVTA